MSKIVNFLLSLIDKLVAYRLGIRKMFKKIIICSIIVSSFVVVSITVTLKDSFVLIK